MLLAAATATMTLSLRPTGSFRLALTVGIAAESHGATKHTAAIPVRAAMPAALLVAATTVAIVQCVDGELRHRPRHDRLTFHLRELRANERAAHRTLVAIAVGLFAAKEFWRAWWHGRIGRRVHRR